MIPDANSAAWNEMFMECCFAFVLQQKVADGN